MENETWKTIENTNCVYEVSNLGRVRSTDHLAKNRWKPIERKGKVLKAPTNAYGYPIVSIRVGKKPTTQTVHRLVAAAFLPPPATKMEVNHKDGDKTNNRASNLEWSDRESNMRHASEQNLMRTQKQRKACILRSKINLEVAEEIRKAVKNGLSQDKAAKQFGTHQPTVSKIVRNLIWCK